MKIRNNLVLLSLIFVILIVIIGFIMFLTFIQVKMEIKESDRVNKIIKDISELSMVTHEYFMHHETRMKHQWELKYVSFGDLLFEIAGKIEGVRFPERLSILESITSDYKALGDQFSQIQANFAKMKRIIRENRPQVEINLTFSLEERLMAQALIRAQKISSKAFKLSGMIKQNIARVQQRTNLIVLFSIIGFSIFSFIISFFVIRAITRPINEIVKGAGIIGKGNLDHRVELKAKNEIGELAAAFNQMTERRKQAEEELQTERDKFQGVLNAIGEGLYIVNRDFTIEYQNEVLKKSFGDRKGDRCCSVFFQSKEPCEFCPLSEVLESGKMQNIEATLPDGRDYDIFFSPFADVDGNVKAIVLLRDITEKKTLQAEAMRVGHLSSLGELAAGVAHEINNPINGIISVAEILRDQCYAQGEDDEIPTRIIKEGDRIAKIVKNLLSFARDRKEELNPAYVQDILKDALSLVEKQITRDGAKLNMDVPPDLPKIKARTQEIQQVFLNILSNARYALKKKFKGPHEDKILEIRGDTIEIESRKHVRVTFYDRGVGISKNILDKICDPFFSTKPQGEGTGLGLSISHGIVKNHDGRLWFESVEGEYTKVIVDLPVDNGWELSDGESRE